jgi:ankyrin repeat protein
MIKKSFNNYPGSMHVKIKENARIRELNLKLLEACKLEDIVRVKELVEKGANLHLLSKTALHPYNSHERSLVHIAAQIGDLDILKYLIEQGANYNAQARRGEAPLHLAVFNNYRQIIEFLITECNAAIEIKDLDGGTPLSWAVYENKLDCVKLLLNLGANINEPDYEKRTPLHWAVYQKHKKMVKFLALQGANLIVKNNDDETALDIAINNGYSDLVQILCKVAEK